MRRRAPRAARCLRDLRALSSDDTVRCVVLTGAGRAFSAGQDLREPDALVDVDAVIRETYIPIVETLVGMPKPVVAAINGAAAGAGLSFALACDLRYMAEGAVLMMAFSNIGLVPDCGGTWLLVRAVGHARAFELAATGRRVQAPEALVARARAARAAGRRAAGRRARDRRRARSAADAGARLDEAPAARRRAEPAGGCDGAGGTAASPRP